MTHRRIPKGEGEAKRTISFDVSFFFFFAFCRAGDLADNLARIFAFIDLLHRAISDLSGHSPFIWRYDYATLKKSRLFSEKVF